MTTADSPSTLTLDGNRPRPQRLSPTQRLVLRVLRHVGMTGAWYSTLHDAEIRALPDLGVGKSAVQEALRRGESSGRIARFASRAAFLRWADGLGDQVVAEARAAPRSAERVIVDLHLLTERFGVESPRCTYRERGIRAARDTATAAVGRGAPTANAAFLARGRFEIGFKR